MKNQWDTKDWQEVKAMLPKGWQEKAWELAAMRRGRKIKTPEELLQLLLLHVGPGLSLAQAVARAVACGLPQVSDVALLLRMRACMAWLRWICQQLLEEAREDASKSCLPAGLRFIAVDGTLVHDIDRAGASWRLHYAIELSSLFCEQATVTDIHEGESLERFSVQENDVLLGDRNFCKPAQIRSVLARKGHILLRWHSTALPLYEPNRDSDGNCVCGDKLDVLAWLRTIADGECALREVCVSTEDSPLRLFAVRANSTTAKTQREAVEESARKSGRSPSAESLELANYIVLVSSLPAGQFNGKDVMRLYRLRWQVELAFKRLKSLLGCGQVPKTDPRSALVWLQCKVLTSLLIEKLLRKAGVFSPCGSAVLP